MKKFLTFLAYLHQAWRLILTDKLVTTEDEFGARDNPGKDIKETQNYEVELQTD